MNEYAIIHSNKLKPYKPAKRLTIELAERTHKVVFSLQSLKLFSISSLSIPVHLNVPAIRQNRPAEAVNIGKGKVTIPSIKIW